MKELDPIIILSAAPRMGTTLVQRLLCSARDCLIFGDTIGHDAAFLASYLSSKQIAIRSHAPRTDPLLQGVLGGNTAEFIADLSPPSEAHLDVLAAMAAHPLALCRDTARSHGRPVWGWKQAGAQAWFIGLLPSVFPKARVIQVDRDLAGTARSAKAAEMVGEGADFSRFIQGAHHSRQALASLSGKLPLLRIDLADLLEKPEAVISSLEDFSSCARIDRSVLSVKLNHPQGVLLPPAGLSDAEAAFIETLEPSQGHALLA
jgi:hypothetical protein